MRTMYLRTILTFAALFASHHLAMACDQQNQLERSFVTQHPRSLDVAFAIRDAAKSGLLKPVTLITKSDDMLKGGRVLQRLQRLGNAIAISTMATSNSDASSGFTLLLVDNSLWSRYRATPDGVVFKVRTDGAHAGETVVITGLSVLAALDAGDLTPGDALYRDLIVIVPGNTANMRQVLSAFTSFAKADNPDQLALSPGPRILDRSEE